jgi:Tol biopolymer transport system component
MVAALILLVLALVIVAVGSYQQRLPAPFGLARNGQYVASRDGEIYLVDPTTNVSRPAVVGEGFDFSPIFSRDGTKMLYLRSEAAPTTGVAVLTLYVAKADGSDPRAITPPTESLDWMDWSPEGTRIVYMAKGSLYVVDVVTGEAPRKLVGTGPAHFPTFMPPDGKEIVYRSEGRSPAVWAIPADGTGERRRLSTTPANNQFDYQGIAVSPDGSTVTFTRWSERDAEGRPFPDSVGWFPHAYALDVATGEERLLPTEPGTGLVGGAFSPDGLRIASARIYREGAFQIVVANADGSGDERIYGPRRPTRPDGASLDATWSFTPDGQALVLQLGNDTDRTMMLIPLDGSPTVEIGSGGQFGFMDVQRVAP